MSVVNKGSISLASEFPTLVLVQEGWQYTILDDVVDNDSAKTNTGMSFSRGDTIIWVNSSWCLFNSQVTITPQSHNYGDVEMLRKSSQQSFIFSRNGSEFDSILIPDITLPYDFLGKRSHEIITDSIVPGFTINNGQTRTIQIEAVARLYNLVERRINLNIEDIDGIILDENYCLILDENKDIISEVSEYSIVLSPDDEFILDEDGDIILGR